MVTDKEPDSLPLVSVIMAVYNEEDTVCQVVDQLLAKSFTEFRIELVIIESNSSDTSREKVTAYQSHPKVKLVLQGQANGKGNAIREGFGHASGEILIIQDADNEYSLADYPLLIGPIIAGKADFVLGTRHQSGKPMRVMDGEPLNSRMLNLGHVFFVWFFNLMYRTHLTDPFTMFKVFRTECIDGLTFKANRFDFDWELVGKLVRSNYLPLEIPITYKARGFGEGKKVSWVRDPASWVIAAIRFRVERLTKTSDGR